MTNGDLLISLILRGVRNLDFLGLLKVGHISAKSQARELRLTSKVFLSTEREIEAPSFKLGAAGPFIWPVVMKTALGRAPGQTQRRMRPSLCSRGTHCRLWETAAGLSATPHGKGTVVGGCKCWQNMEQREVIWEDWLGHLLPPI